MSDSYLEIQKTASEIQQMYDEDESQKTFNCLLLGEMGVGKTHMVGVTARAPIMIMSFDPGGTKGLRPEIKEGKVLPVTKYEQEPKKGAQAFRDWERDYEKWKRRGFFENIGTLCIDSFTTWLSGMTREIAKRKNRPDNVLQIKDWQIVGSTLRDYVHEFNSLPCDTIMTGHIALSKDELEGGFKATINAPPSLQISLPILYDEIYVLEAREKNEGISRKVITQNTGKYECRTRIGRDSFEIREEANFKYLLRKAGYPTEDKPLFNQESKTNSS